MPETDDKPVDSQLHCPECEYNLTGLASPRCPWCGWRIDIVELTVSRSGARARRLSAVAACLVLGVGSLASLVSLAWTGLSALSIRDGLAIIGAGVGALGHLYLAALLAFASRQWPMRRQDSRNALRLVGWLCVALAIVGATPLLRVRIVQGFAVTSVFEFVLAAVFFAMPGWTLLVMVMLAFRHGTGRSQHPSRTPDDAEALDGECRAPFAVNVIDSFRPHQIVQSWSDAPRPTTPAIEAAIARTWEAETAVAPDQGRSLYNGALVRVQAVDVQPSRLEFTFGPTTYCEFLGTNLHPDAAVAKAEDPFLANPLGVSAVVIARDGALVFGRRSNLVAFHAGYIHTFGGMLEEVDRQEGGTYDLFGSITREVCEELGLRPAQIAGVRHVALVHDLALRQPEMLFDVTITLDAGELQSLFTPTPNGEHTAIEFVEDAPEAASAFLERVDHMAPVAEAALLLHGRVAWGRSWYERICVLRYGEVPHVIQSAAV